MNSFRQFNNCSGAIFFKLDTFNIGALGKGFTLFDCVLFAFFIPTSISLSSSFNSTKNWRFNVLLSFETLHFNLRFFLDSTFSFGITDSPWRLITFNWQRFNMKNSFNFFRTPLLTYFI